MPSLSFCRCVRRARRSFGVGAAHSLYENTMTDPSDLLRRASELTEQADHEENIVSVSAYCEWRSITSISPRAKNGRRASDVDRVGDGRTQQPGPIILLVKRFPRLEQNIGRTPGLCHEGCPIGKAPYAWRARCHDANRGTSVGRCGRVRC